MDDVEEPPECNDRLSLLGTGAAFGLTISAVVADGFEPDVLPWPVFTSGESSMNERVFFKSSNALFNQKC